MTLTLERSASAPKASSAPDTRPGRRGGWVLFGVCFVGYAAIGYYLFQAGFINPDASSRTANAGYTTMSRFPHLGAVGFVWNPLPSFAQIPLIPFHAFWPELKTMGLTGIVQSAAFMAGASVLVRRIGFDAHVSRTVTWTAVVAFALNPMVVLYGSNGMSEAPFLFVLLWSCRRLLQWGRTGATVDLCIAGIALGLGYLVRYEVLIVAGAATVLVLVMSCRRYRTGDSWRTGLGHAWHDGAVVAFPTAMAFAVWALAGWLLDANILAQFTSQYGNSAQIEAAGIVGVGEVGVRPLLGVIAAQVFGIAPLVIVVGALVLAAALLRREHAAAIPTAIFGSILLFQCVAILLGSTFGWFRFFIVLVPLLIVSLLAAWPTVELPASRWRGARPWRMLLCALMIGVLVTSLPVTWRSMMDPSLGREEFGLRSVLWPQKYPPDEFAYIWSGEVAENTVRWFDSQDLPDGSVLIDTFGLARLWLASERPRQFVVRSDYDFFDKLNNLSNTGVQYVLIRRPTDLGRLDAINVRYPTMWDTGAQVSSLVMTVTGPDGEPQYRIFKIHRRDTPVTGE